MRNFLSRQIAKSVWTSWYQFWFAQQSPLAVFVFRLVFGLVMFGAYLNRHFAMSDFYGADSFVSWDLAPRLMYPGLRPPLYFMEIIPELSHGFVFGLHLLMTFGFLALAIGWLKYRFLVFFLWLLHQFFLQRNFSIVYGIDMIGGLWLLYLSLVSVPKLRLRDLLNWRHHLHSKLQMDALSAVSLRLLQVHLCVIYFYTGAWKLRGFSWWDGTALWKVLGNQQLATLDFSFLGHFPLAISILTFSTVVFELYFPVLVWIAKVRPMVLLLGLFFHLGICLSMGLFFFSAVMVAPYILFYFHQPRFSQDP